LEGRERLGQKACFLRGKGGLTFRPWEMGVRKPVNHRDQQGKKSCSVNCATPSLGENKIKLKRKGEKRGAKVPHPGTNVHASHPGSDEEKTPLSRRQVTDPFSRNGGRRRKRRGREKGLGANNLLGRWKSEGGWFLGVLEGTLRTQKTEISPVSRGKI